MKPQDHIQPLQGTPNEQVEQFLNLLDKRELSVEALAKLIPLTEAFMTTLFDYLKRRLEFETKEHAENIQQINNLLQVLREVLQNPDFTEDERNRVIDILDYTSKSLHEIETTRTKEEYKTIRFLIATMGCVILFLGVLVAKKEIGSTNN